MEMEIEKPHSTTQSNSPISKPKPKKKQSNVKPHFNLNAQPNVNAQPKVLRTTKTLKPQTHSKRKQLIESMNVNEINALIASTREIKHNYSRSTTLTYVPLTKLQKITMIEEMNTASSNKMITYSGIFNEIKNQISDLSVSLKGSFTQAQGQGQGQGQTDKKPQLKAKGSTRLAYYYTSTNNNEQINEEIDEELIKSPLDIQKTIHFPPDDSLLGRSNGGDCGNGGNGGDDSDLGCVDELKNNIVVNKTLQYHNDDNAKLFEKVKGRKINIRSKQSPKVLQNQIRKTPNSIGIGSSSGNRSRMNQIIPHNNNYNERQREEQLTNTTSINHPSQMKDDSMNMNKTNNNNHYDNNESSIVIESCQCIAF